MNYKMITTEEIISLLFYQGNTSEIKCENQEKKSFYDIHNAYEAINMLLFEGTENEDARLLCEQRIINVELLDDIDELLKVYCNLYSAMCKYTNYIKNFDKNNLHTYRYDRAQSLTALEQGQTPSFFSTSENQETDEYFRQKNGLIIFDIMTTVNTVHINMNQVLGENTKFAEEQEILFPPYLKVSLEKDKLSEKERGYRDKNEPPIGKYRVVLENNSDLEKPIMRGELLRSYKQQILQEIHSCELLDIAKQVWESYNHGVRPDELLLIKYCYWKKKLQNYIMIRYGEIYRDIFFNNKEKRAKLLFDCIDTAIVEANRKREKYERKLFHQGIILAFLRGVTVLFIGINLMEVGKNTVFESYIKVFTLFIFLFTFFINEIFKGMELRGKLRQRTETFLKLDELERDLRFEESINLEQLNLYIERYKQVIKDDNRWCEKNTESLAKLSENVIHSDIKDHINKIIK